MSFLQEFGRDTLAIRNKKSSRLKSQKKEIDPFDVILLILYICMHESALNLLVKCNFLKFFILKT